MLTDRFYSTVFRLIYAVSVDLNTFTVRTVDGDMGIEITKEEFNKLKFGALTCTCMPSDYDVVHALWGDR